MQTVRCIYCVSFVDSFELLTQSHYNYITCQTHALKTNMDANEVSIVILFLTGRIIII